MRWGTKREYSRTSAKKFRTRLVRLLLTILMPPLYQKEAKNSIRQNADSVTGQKPLVSQA